MRHSRARCWADGPDLNYQEDGGLNISADHCIPGVIIDSSQQQGRKAGNSLRMDLGVPTHSLGGRERGREGCGGIGCLKTWLACLCQGPSQLRAYVHTEGWALPWLLVLGSGMSLGQSVLRT